MLNQQQFFCPFQYNHCFGGTVNYLNRINYLISFNTTIVSVERGKKVAYIELPKCFNTTIVSVEHIVICYQNTSFTCFNTTIVSVEQVSKFHFSDDHSRFNTTIVSVERFSILIDSLIRAFQYNHCFGGTIVLPAIVKEYFNVSIQPLFRWNLKLLINLKKRRNSFNTTIVSVERIPKQYLQKEMIVSIQPLFRWNFDVYFFLERLYKFQYNHCFGGTF